MHTCLIVDGLLVFRGRKSETPRYLEQLNAIKSKLDQQLQSALNIEGSLAANESGLRESSLSNGKSDQAADDTMNDSLTDAEVYSHHLLHPSDAATRETTPNRETDGTEVSNGDESMEYRLGDNSSDAAAVGSTSSVDSPDKKSTSTSISSPYTNSNSMAQTSIARLIDDIVEVIFDSNAVKPQIISGEQSANTEPSQSLHRGSDTPSTPGDKERMSGEDKRSLSGSSSTSKGFSWRNSSISKRASHHATSMSTPDLSQMCNIAFARSPGRELFLQALHTRRGRQSELTLSGFKYMTFAMSVSTFFYFSLIAALYDIVVQIFLDKCMEQKDISSAIHMANMSNTFHCWYVCCVRQAYYN
jgi:hypothetical protein